MEEQKVVIPEPKQEQRLSVGDGFIGMFNAFVDPAGLAKRVPAPLSWLWPVITLIIIYVVFGYLMLPYTLSVVDLAINQRIREQNVPVEQAQRAADVAHKIYQFLPIASPVLVILFLLLFAWLVSAMASMAGLRTKFRNIFALMAACQLIQALQTIATYIVIRAKGDEITSQEQLTPPFGLDIFLQNIHGALYGLVNFFSIFEIWYLVVLTIALAYLGKSSKSKAFSAIMPAWILTLIIKMVQAMLQGPQGN